MDLLRLDKYNPLPWEKKADGRYWTYITLGEVGHPLTYLFSDKRGNTQKRVEVVSEGGLFNDSVKSVVGLPILLTHPKSRRYNLNRDGLKVGHLLGTIGREDGKLIAEAIVDDYRAVEIIDRLLAEGKTPEASSGYLLSELREREDGIFEQIREAYDHVAAPLLPGQGRGGQNLTLRFDTGDAVVEPLYWLFDTDRKEEKTTFVSDLIVRIDEKDQRILKDVNDDVKDAITALQSRIDTLISDLEGTEERIEELQTEKDTLQGRLDAADTNTDSSGDIETAVQARFDAWNEVIPVVGSDKLEIDGKLTPSQIKAKAIKLLNPSLNLDGKSEGYIEGLWEGVRDKGQRKTDRFLQTAPRNDSNGGKRSVVVSNYEGAYKRSRRNANN
ncbi:MAG: DUF2213 domain-containing protein [Symploca sp. SIO2G7]|nr:DUF2213 domain-containing protein [Symploca sp. SIO2G7]